jgi:NADPH-dependent 2,4-dienoyl-CoA reductase/sulfur reductase-like enzyme/rhodanese-related sulfurtransferase
MLCGKIMNKKVVIVGGVAGGATCATRLRRLDENAEIVVLDRGPYVSFANCGLPYYVGDVIQKESSLLLATPELFQNRFRIDVRIKNEVLSIDRESKTLLVSNRESGLQYRESFDALVLSPGAEPITPPWPGVDLPGIFTLRSVPDSRAIRNWIEAKRPQNAIIVGGGFIGLEMAENLAARGIRITLVELATQVLPPLDPEMAQYAKERLASRGTALRLGDGVAGFRQKSDGSLLVLTETGAEIEADMVVLAVGVRPEAKLAREAGLEIGQRGGIRVNDQMRTSDSNIWAVGDAVEVRNTTTGAWEVIPLAGPANRQGRVAADAICGRASRFHGTQGTTVCGFFGLSVALTGATEKALRRAGITDFESVYLHPNQHVAYYPGAKPMHLKLIFRPSDGRVLGAQAAGDSDVARRIDVIATAIYLNATVNDLEDLELCYAPQFGGAKDPVNFAGMIAANVMRGDLELAPWQTMSSAKPFVLDVREPEEYRAGSVPGAVNIPLDQLRSRLKELPQDTDIWVTCKVGQRAYYACRILSQHGLRAKNLSGGYSTFEAIRSSAETLAAR